ncbi:MAG: DnaD domain protein [Chloroflexota bacterium]
MSAFNGFPSGKVRLTPIPGPFFWELLPQIDDLFELKVTLYVFWCLDRMEGTFRYLEYSDFAEDILFMQGLGGTPEEAKANLEGALRKVVERGTLLMVEAAFEDGPKQLYFLNSPRGRAAVEGIKLGRWSPSEVPEHAVMLEDERPNIFALYETHIGPLTPMIAEKLRDAEDMYPSDWIEDAFRIAVENNVRRWRYIEAILRSWHEEGRDERRHQGNTEKDRRRYVEGKFSEFIEH